MENFNLAWFKEHPWLTGVVVVVGGFIFLSITGLLGGKGSGSSGGTAVVNGSSDAQLAASIAATQAQDHLQETQITTQAQLTAQSNTLSAELQALGMVLSAQGSNGNTPSQDGVSINGKFVPNSALPGLDAANKIIAANAAAAGEGVIFDPQWGALQNEVTNIRLTEDTGYTGAFGNGGFEKWIIQQPSAIQKIAANDLTAAGEQSRIVGFGTSTTS